MTLVIFYGLFALAAFLATHGDHDLGLIGIFLAGGFLASNALFLFAPVTARPAPYTLIETLVALAAYCAFEVRGHRALIAIVILNIVSICANVAFSLVFPPDQRQVLAFETTTNLTFAAECVLATWVGIAYGRGRLAGWLGRRWRSAEPDASQEAQGSLTRGVQ